MTAQEIELQRQLQSLKASIRTIVHDVSNPLGVLRMTAYYLQHGDPEKDKVDHYLTMIGETVEKIAAGLIILRDLSDEPPSSPSLPEVEGSSGSTPAP
ncbi:MAG TPA: hypothetical protein VMF59_16270 [Bacteroidota bacterium]|nr:hypothetical protein [Bacteroidota bacterium]